jgi:putative spermidine/putrescine transport system ATP-binding protein
MASVPVGRIAAHSDPGAPPQGASRRGAPIRLDRLQKAYGETVVVRDLTLSVGAGEFLTLLGPSGSGKTTTLMMIAGFVPASGGDIFIDGRAVGRVPPERRQLGMVFQSYALFPHMTVAENIAFPLRMRRRPRREIREKVGRALEMVQLAGYEARMPSQLSGGQQQRVALARATVFEPRVLLMDEPLGSLDKKLRGSMQAEIKRIQQRLEMTVIYVTHDQEEALTMSDRIAVMQNGVLQQIGTPAALYDEPTNAFVADFLGESNFLSGRVTAVGVDGRVEVEHGTGRRFRADHAGAVKPGTPIVAAIRPERIALVTEAAADGDRNLWKGRICEVIFLGDSIKYKVAIDDLTVTIKTQGRSSIPAVGDEVGVCWSAAHTALLRDETCETMLEPT